MKKRFLVRDLTLLGVVCLFLSVLVNAQEGVSFRTIVTATDSVEARALSSDSRTLSCGSSIFVGEAVIPNNSMFARVTEGGIRVTNNLNVVNPETNAATNFS